GSVGHTGFTGTMVWIDPPTRTYMIVLTSRLHPSGNDSGRIRELRTRVAAAVGAALFYQPTPVAVAAGGGGEPGPAADAPLPTGLPLWSLYGATRRPTPEMLHGLTALVYDVQDVGVRYYTYLATLVYAMQEAAKRQLPVFVLDRPDPITGRIVEGPLIDPDLR